LVTARFSMMAVGGGGKAVCVQAVSRHTVPTNSAMVLILPIRRFTMCIALGLFIYVDKTIAEKHPNGFTAFADTYCVMDVCAR
jgi:predicted RNA-binding protein with EMAP domain